jgi:2-polyprenyl-3-methyl-5-hydroxy-6-metoxy-1,4-benzoquinol methylase
MTTDKSAVSPVQSGDQQQSTSAPKSPTQARDEWNQRYAEKELIWTAKPNQALVAEVADLPAGRALDLAAGEGRNAVWLAEQGWTVLTVDFAEKAIEKAEKLAAARQVADKLEFKVADLMDYAPEPESADLVIMMYLHLSVADLPMILKRAARAVAPGGTFLLVAHDSENIAHGHGGPQRAEVLYTAEFVSEIVGDLLEVEKAERIERTVQTDEGDKTAIDCLVRARRV